MFVCILVVFLIHTEFWLTMFLQVHFGVNSGATRFALEHQAVNEATFRCPDELGWKPQVNYESEDFSFVLPLLHVNFTSLDLLYPSHKCLTFCRKFQ